MSFGWRQDLERYEELETTQTPFALPMLGDPPLEIDPRPFHKMENQGPVGSCQGHDLSSCVEHCDHIASGAVRQFSRAHAYYGTQQIDGLLGSDNGSTISGGVKLAKETGLVLEEVWPYIARYNPRPPMPWEKIAELAASNKIRSHSVIKDERSFFNYLASGVGAVTLGTMWGFEPNAQGVVEQWRPGRGGHATAVLGYSARKDSQGRNYYWLANSWGTSWGNQGWAEIAPAAMEAALGHQWTVAIGISDLTVPEQRPISWAANPIM